MKTVAEKYAFHEFSTEPPALESLPKNAIVLLSGLQSVFGPQLASFWRHKGLDVVVISIEQNARSGILPDGTVILAAKDYENKIVKFLKHGPISWLSKFEKRFYSNRPATQKIVEPYVYHSAIRYIGFSLGVIRLVHQLAPRVVFVQCMMRFGYAASVLSASYPTLLMPYGQDIFRHSLSSLPHRWVANRAAQRVHMLCPASATARQTLIEDFGASDKSVRTISWGVDTKLFSVPDREEKLALRKQYDLPAHARIVMNIRRFAKGWGSRIVAEAFLTLAKRNPDYYFVLIGGAGPESTEEFALLMEQVKAQGLGDRFKIFEAGVTLENFADLAKLSDIFVSLMLGSDMRSASILQGIATETAPVVTDWKEYREMEKLGFEALFVPLNDPIAVIEAVESYHHNEALIKSVTAANLRYIENHEIYEKQMQYLLDTMDEVIALHSDEPKRRLSGVMQ